MIGHPVELRPIDYTRGKKLRRRKPVSSSAKVGVRHESLLKAERERLELTYEQKRLHTACLLASRAAAQREAYAAKQRAALARASRQASATIERLLGGEVPPACEGRWLRWGGLWRVATVGDHDHPLALVRSPTGHTGIVELGACVADTGDWKLWEARVLIDDRPTGHEEWMPLSEELQRAVCGEDDDA